MGALCRALAVIARILDVSGNEIFEPIFKKYSCRKYKNMRYLIGEIISYANFVTGKGGFFY